MARDVKIAIKASNEVAGPAKAAVRDLERMRQPIERVRSGMSGIGAILRGDIGMGLSMLGQSMIGRFGALAAKLGMIGAAFAGGFQIGKWIREFTGLGKVMDRLIVPAKVVASSIEDIAKKRTEGLNASLEATRKNLKDIEGAAGKAAAAFASLNEKAAAGVELNTQRQVQALMAGAENMPEPVARAREQEIRARGGLEQAGLSESTARKEAESQRMALQATRQEIAKTEQALDGYRKAQEESARIAGRVRADALAGAPGAQQELEKQLANFKTAGKQIEATQAHLVELTKMQADQQTSVNRAEAAQERATAGVVAAKNDVLEAERGISEAQKAVDLEADEKRKQLAEERLQLEQQIAGNLAQVEKADIGNRWQEQLEKANDEAEKLRDTLEAREAMGAPGTREFRQAQKAQRQTENRERRRRDVLRRMGVEFDEEGLLKDSVDDVQAKLSKQGRKLSKEDIERLRRDEMRARIRQAELDAQIAKENLEGGAQADELAWRKALLLANENMAEKLATLLQAAPG